MTKAQTITGGGFYKRDRSGRLEPIAGQDHAPDVWICRRVADFAPAPIPAGGIRDTCTRCGADILYAGPPRDGPDRICFQCAGITPLPIEH